MTLVIKRGDRLPALTATLTDGGDPVDLSTAEDITVRCHRLGVLVFERTVSGDANGVVTVPWQAGDTDESGKLLLDFRVTWPGSTPQTFPKEGRVVVRVSPRQE